MTDFGGGGPEYGARQTAPKPALIPYLILLGLVCLPSYAQYSGGTGTPEDPYQIATAQDLVDLGDNPNDYDKHFILTAEIDLSGYTFNQAIIAPDTEPSSPGFFHGTVFSGSFDGNGHSILNLVITGRAYLGLFGQIGSQAKASNLGIVDVDVISIGADHDNIGGLVGENFGSVVNCYSSGTVTGEAYVGGLVGVNSGSIRTSFSTGTVIGGLAGGLMGYSWGGTITASYSTGTVTGVSDVGGLVGSNSGSITTSYSTGNVTGNGGVGGLVGISFDSITASYSTGSVTGFDDVGGLVGSDWFGTGVVTSSFWDREASARGGSDGGTGLTTVLMQDLDTFLKAGWDFMNENENGTEDIWWILDGQDYPRLWWELDEP